MGFSGLGLDRSYWNETDQTTVLAELMRRRDAIEEYQAAARKATKQFNQLLEESELAAATWGEFREAGGVTADQFGEFMGGKFRYRRQRTNKHLRLVAVRQPVKIKLQHRTLNKGRKAK
jgi:hypothetical protein